MFVQVTSPAAEPYISTMRRLVAEVSRERGDMFSLFLERIDLTEIDGLNSLRLIADEIFAEGENNWGRIVVGRFLIA